ncbi:MAG: hypothetical protein P8M05_11385 [Flavobacteriales bacterium]|nr:hypothetical protein [Flavobacteriales bacterium]
MEVDFNSLPNQSKVWMYQANRLLNDEDKKVIYELAEVFLSQWESHNIPVNGAIDTLNNCFVRIAAFTDEPNMCGRAQDAQVRLAKEIELELGIELTNRLLLAFEIEGETEIVHMNDLANEIRQGRINADSNFYNNLIQSKQDFDASWVMKAGESWLSKYF